MCHICLISTIFNLTKASESWPHASAKQTRPVTLKNECATGITLHKSRENKREGGRDGPRGSSKSERDGSSTCTVTTTVSLILERSLLGYWQCNDSATDYDGVPQAAQEHRHRKSIRKACPCSRHCLYSLVRSQLCIQNLPQPPIQAL